MVRAVRHVVLLFVVAGAAVLAMGVVASPAQAAPVVRDIDGGNVRVSVDRNYGFSSGDPVTIVVEGRNGTTLNMVSVNQCLKDPINHWEFAADGGFCAEAPLSVGHDAQQEEGPLGPGIRQLEITYRVGTGVQQVDDMFGVQRELGCQEGRTCFLSLYVQETNDPDVQLSFPISFGSDPPPPPLGGDQGGAEPGRAVAPNAGGAGGEQAAATAGAGDPAGSGDASDRGSGVAVGIAGRSASDAATGSSRTAGVLLALVLTVALVFWAGVWFARRRERA